MSQQTPATASNLHPAAPLAEGVTPLEEALPPRPSGHLPAGIDPLCSTSVDRFLQSDHLPRERNRHFLFAFIDPIGRVESVFLRHGLAGHREAVAFHRCEGGVFVLDFHAPAVNRMEYQLGLLEADGNEQHIVDPLNSLAVRDPFVVKSVVLAEGYAVPLHVGPPAHLLGTLDEGLLPGPQDDQWRSWIWQPTGATADDELPLVLLLDGGDYLWLSGVRNVFENLVADHAIPPCRAVFVSPSHRNDEYSANPQTATCLNEQLPRELAQMFAIPSDPAKRIGVGASLGGLCLLHTHFTQPSFFGKLLLQSGSYFQPETDPMELRFRHFDRISRFVSKVLAGRMNVPRIPIYMTCGRGGENLANNRAMGNALRSQQFPITLTETQDAHNWTSWRDCIGDGLIALLNAR